MIGSLQSSHEAWIAGAGEASWARDLRRRSLAAFEQIGLPTKKLEGWRYSSTARLARQPFVHDAGPLFEALAGPLAGAHILPGAIAEIVIVNGQLAPGLSRLSALPDGLVVTSINELLAHDDATLAERLDPSSWPTRPDASRGAVPAGMLAPDRGFDALNTAFLQGGVHIEIGAEVEVEGAIHVLLISVGEGAPNVSHARVLVTAGRGSSAQIVERHVGMGGEPALVNVLTDLDLRDGAQLGHHLWRLSGEHTSHVGHVRATVGRDARLVSHTAWLGGLWTRNDLDIRFVGEGGEALLTGVAVVDGKRHIDNHTWLRHELPHCTSREIYKTIAADRATAVFDGLIAIAPHAVRSQAELTSNNLQLSEQATIFARPELEIFNDDVVAAHGCTVGQLPEEPITYLRSRGIDQAQARALLTRGFVLDLLGEIADEGLREQTGEQVRAALDRIFGEGAA